MEQNYYREILTIQILYIKLNKQLVNIGSCLLFSFMSTLTNLDFVTVRLKVKSKKNQCIFCGSWGPV